MPDVSQFDDWLKPDGPAAIVIREWLMPVEGEDGVVFPATFAAGDGFSGGYNIDTDASGNSIALIDSVGSQANRIEPLFMEEPYNGLVPQINVVAGEKTVNILEAGHRAGDALLRCSSMQEELQQAFQHVLKGDASPMAKVAPTSLVFGVWDSRDTQAKLPRLVASTIRAFDVRKLTRGAVYTPPLDYSQQEVFSEEEKAKAEGDTKNPLAIRGFVHVPASGTHGGVIAKGGIRRDATLGLAALRLLRSTNQESTRTLQRYILGIALTAFTSHRQTYLRAGTLLVLNPDKPAESQIVHSNGKRDPFTTSHDEALSYAKLTAEAFGVGPSQDVYFDKERARKDLDDRKAKKQKGGKAKKDEEPKE